MSTRCQVKVIQEGMGWEEAVTLYHHTDGYPEYMVPLIYQAMLEHIRHHDNYPWRNKKNDGKLRWEAGRAGKVASRLCATDPEIFEPEVGHDLHGDIEYYYKLYAVNKDGGLDGNIVWELEVFETARKFWDEPTEENLEVLHSRQPLLELIETYRDNYKKYFEKR